MRYLMAFILVVVGMVPFAVEGDGTFLILTSIAAAALIFCKEDWTKGPYRRKSNGHESL